MIAADTCSLVAFFNDELSDATIAVERALTDGRLALPPVVLTEILSDPLAKALIFKVVSGLSLLYIHTGYWLRVAETRQKLLSRSLKAKLGDALVAQSCIDHHIPLITCDKDFRHYAKHCGLKLYA